MYLISLCEDYTMPSNTLPLKKLPNLGFGLGLRTDHYEYILTSKPPVDWFEIISENYLASGGKPLYHLDKIRESYPMVMHGVSLSIGSSDKLDNVYLSQVKELANRIEPAWISDHLCWTGISGLNMHDLLPLPYTQSVIDHVVSRLHQVQDFLQRPFLLENVSSYLTYKESDRTEWEFLNEIVKRSGCFILLDVNNIYVSSVNHHFDAIDYIEALPPDKIAQIHLAGHRMEGNCIIDTHDMPIISNVWDLYAKAIRRFGPISTMIERDDNIPPLPELLEELLQAKHIVEQIPLDAVSVL